LLQEKECKPATVNVALGALMRESERVQAGSAPEGACNSGTWSRKRNNLCAENLWRVVLLGQQIWRLRGESQR
jgi:hypothetical protein